MPASEATASNSRPMLDVGTQRSPVVSCRSSSASSSSLQARTQGRPVVPRRRPRPRRWDSAIRQGLRTAGVAAGQRDVGEVGGPDVVGVVGDQELAAPDGAVVAVAGAVEGDPEDPAVAAEPVLGHRRGDVGVVVLDLLDRSAVGVVARPPAGAVGRVPVGGERGRA